MRCLAAKPFLAALALVALAMPALAQEVVAPASPPAPAPAPDPGNTAWMILSSVLVLLMTVPGLALFYGGLVRAKNILSVLMQVFAILCVVSMVWVLYGYSLAFTDGGGWNSFAGGFSKAFLSGVTTATTVETFSRGVVIPELAFVLFQMTFACITPGLIVGAFAERMKFSAILLFTCVWFTLAYLPMAHMVWFWAGPDAYTLSPDNFGYIASIIGEDAAQKYLSDLVAATTEDARNAVLASFGAEINSTNGYLFNWGAIDFAGGTVVHVNAGFAGLICALMVGRRMGYGKDAMAPHNLL